MKREKEIIWELDSHSESEREDIIEFYKDNINNYDAAKEKIFGNILEEQSKIQKIKKSIWNLDHIKLEKVDKLKMLLKKVKKL